MTKLRKGIEEENKAKEAREAEAREAELARIEKVRNSIAYAKVIYKNTVNYVIVMVPADKSLRAKYLDTFKEETFGRQFSLNGVELCENYTVTPMTAPQGKSLTDKIINIYSKDAGVLCYVEQDIAGEICDVYVLNTLVEKKPDVVDDAVIRFLNSILGM